MDSKQDESSARWHSVTTRDAAADGRFVYAVKTTGVYCRPSCPSKPAKRENVCFFDDAAEAETQGFRACQRCTPNGPSQEETQADLIAKACRLLEKAETPPPLAELAKELDLSPSHLHRVFKKLTGITPKQWATAARGRKLRAELTNPEACVTEAIYSAGYNTSSRFYEEADRHLGMTATAYKHGGNNTAIRFALGETSLGALLVAQSDKGLCAIALGDDPQVLVHELEDRFPKAQLIGGDSQFEELVAQVAGLVERPHSGFDLPLDLRGTAFQQRVWQALRQIPPGDTLSYAELAQRIGQPSASRAVAQACRANTLAVAVPCHRIIRQDGTLSGYRWGVIRKKALLERERQA